MDPVEQAQGKITLDPRCAHVQGYIQRARRRPGAKHGKAQRPWPLRQPHQDHSGRKGKQRKRDRHDLHPVQIPPQRLHRQNATDGGHGQ